MTMASKQRHDIGFQKRKKAAPFMYAAYLRRLNREIENKRDGSLGSNDPLPENYYGPNIPND